jgi:hypothetical protein
MTRHSLYLLVLGLSLRLSPDVAADPSSGLHVAKCCEAAEIFDVDTRACLASPWKPEELAAAFSLNLGTENNFTEAFSGFFPNRSFLGRFLKYLPILSVH